MKPFRGTTKKCKNKNLPLIFTPCQGSQGLINISLVQRFVLINFISLSSLQESQMTDILKK